MSLVWREVYWKCRRCLAAQLGAVRSQTILDGLGVLVWAVGFFFEAVGDWQLARFTDDPTN